MSSAMRTNVVAPDRHSSAFFAIELIPPLQNYTIVTFRNCKWLRNSHGPSRQRRHALSKHPQRALKTARSRTLACVFYYAVPSPVMKMQRLRIHQHYLGLSTPAGCEQRKLHVNAAV